jgi:hypothetical protein
MKKILLFIVWSAISITIFLFISATVDIYLLKPLKLAFDFGALLCILSLVLGLFIGYYKSFFRKKIEIEEFKSFMQSADEFRSLLSK